ncbi:MAG: hypothetical protein WCP53_13590 [Verrucomicrobiota bacterium]|jgi:hypothetical protein
MNATEQAVLDQLLALDSAVAGMRTTSAKPDLRPILAGLDAAIGRLPSGTAPELLHYLHKRSHEKARLFLQGRDAENAAGNCGHR